MSRIEAAQVMDNFLEDVRLTHGEGAYLLSRSLIRSFNMSRGDDRKSALANSSLLQSFNDGEIRFDENYNRIVYADKEGHDIVFGSKHDPLLPKMVSMSQAFHDHILAAEGRQRDWVSEYPPHFNYFEKALGGIWANLSTEILRQQAAQKWERLSDNEK